MTRGYRTVALRAFGASHRVAVAARDRAIGRCLRVHWPPNLMTSVRVAPLRVAQLSLTLRAIRGRTVKQLQVTATFPRIPSDNLDEFKRMAGEALKVTADDPGVPQYDWFFNEDESKCVVRETYADSDAVLTHLGMLGDKLGTIIELGGGVEIEVFGSPSDALVKATEALQPTIYSYFQGK